MEMTSLRLVVGLERKIGQTFTWSPQPIRRLPTPFEAEALHFVNLEFGQIGAKASALMVKFPTATLPPAMARNQSGRT